MHSPIGAEEFSALMQQFGPWLPDGEEMPPMVVGVSGGADSLCLTYLMSRWRRALLGVIVDHGLRPESAREAEITAQRLRALGVGVRVLIAEGLSRGPGLAARARQARYDLLISECQRVGAIDLLVGHHAADQAETVLMRRRASSGPDGLAGMAVFLERADIRIVRPLLGIHPGRLRATLRQAGLGWEEDPSNRDRKAQRVRVREELASRWAEGDLAPTLLQHAAVAGRERMERCGAIARSVAQGADLRPEGVAFLPPGLVDAAALAALIRTVSGADYPPLMGSVESLVRSPRAATLAGVRLIPAGRYGSGWLLLREEASQQGRVAAAPGVVWDGRFRCAASDDIDFSGVEIGALGRGALSLDMRKKPWPAAVMRVLPALWQQGNVVAVPALGVCRDSRFADVDIWFQPPVPVAQGAVFGRNFTEIRPPVR